MAQQKALIGPVPVRWLLPPAELTVPDNAIEAVAETGETAHDSQLAVVGWNIESGDNDPAVIAAQLKELAGYDIYCLNEVHPDNLGIYAAALPNGFVSIPSTTGGRDRMQISFDGDRFEPLDVEELHAINQGRHRAPLFVRLRDRPTGIEFIVMTNHLARGNERLRALQAAGLRRQARRLPAFTVVWVSHSSTLTSSNSNSPANFRLNASRMISAPRSSLT